MVINLQLIGGVYFLSFLVSLIIGILLYRRKESFAALLLSWFEFAVSLWSLAQLFEIFVTNPQAKELWSQISYIGITSSPILFLAFALAYGQFNKWLKWKYFSPLAVMAGITLLVAVTNPLHKWLWTSISVHPETGLGMYGHGWFFWVFVVFSYLVLSGGIITLFLAVFRFSKVYMGQIATLIVASILPFTGNIMYVFELNPVPGLEWTPVSFSLVGGLIAFGIARFRIFDLTPVAVQQIVSAINDPLVVFDLKGRIIMSNPVFDETFTPDLKSPIGISDHDTIQGIKEFFEIDKGSIAANKSEFRFEGKFYDVQTNPLTGQRNQQLGTILVFRDISLRKQAEESQSYTNKKLREEILQHEQLISDLNSFSHSVAHDLKNPLSNIISFSEILDEIIQEDTEKAIEIARLINTSGEKMLSIIEELLKLSSYRNQDINFTPFDMGGVVIQATQRLSLMSQQYGARIEVPDSWPMVKAYAPWVEEVWVNLISNAIKYGGTPPLFILDWEEVGDMIRFTVQDNGNGLSPEKLSKLFKDFVKLSNKKVEGHGIGLSIVKRIVEKLGGQVGVESDNVSGKGCVFSFTLLKV